MHSFVSVTPSFRFSQVDVWGARRSRRGAEEVGAAPFAPEAVVSTPDILHLDSGLGRSRASEGKEGGLAVSVIPGPSTTGAVVSRRSSRAAEAQTHLSWAKEEAVLVCIRAQHAAGADHFFFSMQAERPLERVFSKWTGECRIPRDEAVFLLGNRHLEGTETPASCGVRLMLFLHAEPRAGSRLHDPKGDEKLTAEDLLLSSSVCVKEEEGEQREAEHGEHSVVEEGRKAGGQSAARQSRRKAVAEPEGSSASRRPRAGVPQLRGDALAQGFSSWRGPSLAAGSGGVVHASGSDGKEGGLVGSVSPRPSSREALVPRRSPRDAEVQTDLSWATEEAVLVCIRADEAEGVYHYFFNMNADCPLESLFSKWTGGRSIPRDEVVFFLGSRHMEGTETPASCALRLMLFLCAEPRPGSRLHDRKGDKKRTAEDLLLLSSVCVKEEEEGEQREAEVGEQKDRKGDVREEQDAEDGEEPLPVCNEGGEEQQIGDADFAQAEAQAMSEVDTHVKVRDQVLDGVGQPLRHRDRVAVVGLRKVKQKMHNGQVGVVMELGIEAVLIKLEGGSDLLSVRPGNLRRRSPSRGGAVAAGFARASLGSRGQGQGNAEGGKKRRGEPAAKGKAGGKAKTSR